MSSYISVLSLTAKQKAKIHNDLIIKQKKDNYNPNPKQLKCYIIDGDNLHLPFNYYFKNFGIPNEDIDHVKITSNFTGKLYPYQEKIALETKEILSENGSVILNLRTGFGKSIFSIYLVCMIGYKCLLLNNISIVSTQFVDTIVNHSTLKYHIVGKTKKRKRGKNEVSIEDADIIICSSMMVEKIPNRDKIGVLLVDECHKFCTENNMNILLSLTPKICIFMSASMKENGLEKILYMIAGKNNIVKYTNDIPFNVYKVNTGVNLIRNFVIRDKNDRNKIWNELVTRQTLSKYRNEVVVELVKELVNIGKKVCVMCCRVSSAKLLKYLLSDMKVDMLIGNMKTYNDSDVLIGTIPKIGTGFDEKSSCFDFNGVRINCLVLVSSNKSNLIFTQVVGRGLRSNDLDVYNIVDEDGISKKHFGKFTEWCSDNLGTVRCELRLKTKYYEGEYEEEFINELD